jgi:glycosyltransferase involved in cell wall biosynthesis
LAAPHSSWAQSYRAEGKMMRVVQVINSFGHQSGGAERLVQDLHLDMLDAGVDAHLVALENCKIDGLRNAMSLGFSSPYQPGALLALRRYLNAITPKPDVMHAHLFPTSACVAALKRLGAIRCPVIFTEHNTGNRRRDKAVFKPIDTAIYREFEKIFCISEATRASLIAAYPNMSGKTEVIENGATLRFENYFHRIPASEVKILSVGRLTKQKNYPAALKAIAMLDAAPVTYTILGEGDDRDELEVLVERLGLSDRVIFKGHKPDITPFLKEADIFLIPSLWEGFGLAAVEGMNASLPVVASDVPGLREVVGTNGACAILVPPAEPKEIAKALGRLIGDAHKRQDMGEVAFTRSKLFDRRVMTEKHIAAYRSITQEATFA